MRKARLFLATILTALGVFMVAVPVSADSTINVLPQCSDSNVTAAVGSSDPVCASAKTETTSGLIKNIVDVLFYILGVVSIIMIIVGGIRYATSAGNSNNVTAANNTIMYALIGLVIAVLAYAIVNFVITAVTTGKSS